MTLDEFSLGSWWNGSASPVGEFTLPQTQPTGNSNSAISGEYGSASEGFLEHSVNSAISPSWATA